MDLQTARLVQRRALEALRDRQKNPAAVALGSLGGSVTSEAKATAARANGARGGRPRKSTTCERCGFVQRGEYQMRHCRNVAACARRAAKLKAAKASKPRLRRITHVDHHNVPSRLVGVTVICGKCEREWSADTSSDRVCPECGNDGAIEDHVVREDVSMAQARRLACGGGSDHSFTEFQRTRKRAKKGGAR